MAQLDELVYEVPPAWCHNRNDLIRRSVLIGRLHARHDELVANALVVALQVIVQDEFAYPFAQAPLAERHDLAQTPENRRSKPVLARLGLGTDDADDIR